MKREISVRWGWAIAVALAFPSPARANPVAIVSAVRGAVEITPARVKKPQRAAFGQPLSRGDRVMVGRGGAATVFFDDGNVIELSEQSSITIGARIDKPAKAELASEVFTQVSHFVAGGSRQSGLVALSAMRGASDASTPLIVAPRRTSLLSPRPAFVWHRVAGAQRYRASVSSQQGEVWTREATDTMLAYPADAPELSPESDYLWEVEARSETASLRKESAFFHVLSAEVAQAVGASLGKIDSSLGADTPAGHYLAGSYLSARELYADAIPHFEALCRLEPDSPGPHEALGKAYAAVGLADRAALEFERALALSRVP